MRTRVPCDSFSIGAKPGLGAGAPIRSGLEAIIEPELVRIGGRQHVHTLVPQVRALMLGDQWG